MDNFSGRSLSSSNSRSGYFASPEGDWIGGDLTRSDDPCGFQGRFVAYSDSGYDGVEGGSDDSLQLPAWLSGTEYGNPCANGRCCIAGSTRLRPKLPDGTMDYTCCWGAGLALSLSAVDASYKADLLPYAGPAKGLQITLDGDLRGEQQILIAFTQSEDDTNAPFTPFSSLGTKEVRFQDVSCPSWATDCTETGYGGAHPYALDVIVMGGESAGDFKVCITSIIPIL